MWPWKPKRRVVDALVPVPISDGTASTGAVLEMRARNLRPQRWSLANDTVHSPEDLERVIAQLAREDADWRHLKAGDDS